MICISNTDRDWENPSQYGAGSRMPNHYGSKWIRIRDTDSQEFGSNTDLGSNVGARLVRLRYGGQGLRDGLLDGGLSALVFMNDLLDAGGCRPGANAGCQEPQ